MKEALKLALEALEGVVKNCWRDIPSWRLDEIKEQITAIKQALAAPVQEQKPYAYANPDDLSADTAFRWCKINEFTMPVYTTPPAQPAVPDAFGTREGEHPQYVQGWNDCRAEMLRGKP
jgi:hypothetical protein